MTRRFPLAILAICVCWLTPKPAHATFTLTFDDADFGIASVFNDVADFRVEIVVDDDLAPGQTYTNPALVQVDYSVQGVLNSPTPSGFPGFQLVRSIGGAAFYGLSPEAALSFTVRADADLSDGLQINELAGNTPAFEFNAREFNQQPGRYHPPRLRLNADGTGQLINANNQSTFPNPDPPIGSGLLVDVDFGDEYDVALSFDPGLTIAGPVAVIPEPAGLTALGGLGLMILCRSRRRTASI